LQRLQHSLWYSLGFKGPSPDLSWNTAISFTTNTNWQAYSGESTLGHLVQFADTVVDDLDRYRNTLMEREELLAAARDSLDLLDHAVTNLLDATRP
jgi:hypothetical protein